MNFAIGQGIIFLNPCVGVEPPTVPAGRVHYLQPTELHAVLEVCPEWLRPIAAILAFTGMRRSELLGLRWLDIDRKGNRILLPQTKNGATRTVWLNALACKVLDSIPRNDARSTDRLFPASEHTPENVSLAFLRACRKVEIADFRLHDLRHTAASWMRRSGADIHTVARQLGHKDLRMAAQYQHLADDYLEDAIKGLDRVFVYEVPGLSLPPAGAGKEPANGHDDPILSEPESSANVIVSAIATAE